MHKASVRAFHIMLLIPTALLLVYHYLPMGGIVIAFQNYKPAKGILDSTWVGLKNFTEVFSRPGFHQALTNTIVIAVLKIISGLAVPIIFALLLNEIQNTTYKRITQTIVYLPHFISWILLSGILLDILSPTYGILNKLLSSFGIDPIFFLGDNKWFKPVLIITEIWKSFGWGTIIYMGALAGVDRNLYEAASIDGAGRWRQTLHITIPGIISTIIIQATLSLGNVLNAGFDQVYNLMTPITMESGDIIDTMVYRLGMEQSNFGMSTAVGLFKSVIGAFLIVLSYKLAHKTTGYKIF